MSVLGHQEMHGQHRCRTKETAHWQDEIASWSREYEDLRADLPTIEAALRDHAMALQAHADAIAGHEKRVGEHEHALAEYEQGGSGEGLIELAQAHQREDADHRLQRDAHERIKMHHHTLLARWKMFLKSLKEAV